MPVDPSNTLAAPAEPVAVLGVGVEGMATIRYLKRRGVRDIIALDQKPLSDLPPGVRSMVGPSYLEGLGQAATVFRSPGIRPDLPALVAARQRGTRVTSALNEFLARCPSRTVGVTGTVGKGTASTLTYEMLRKSGITAHLAGNIGNSPLELIDNVGPEDVVVLEISSFQAMDLERSPEVCTVLRTTSEHLDWHTGLDEYRQAKAGMVRHQRPRDALVFCSDSPGSLEIAASSRAEQRAAYSLVSEVENGAYRSTGSFVLRREGHSQTLSLSPAELRIAGAFNQENVLAALLSALAAGASVDACLTAAAQFEGLPHRLELAARSRKVRFFNDSYATRPEATIGALGCFAQEPVALILGGSEKHADFTSLAAVIAACGTLVHVALIGQTALRLKDAIFLAHPRADLPIETYEGLEPAMEACVRAVRDSGGVVLMSPACASFGLFPNYKVRGETFRAEARRLAASLD